MLSGELQAAHNVCKEEMQQPGEGAVEEPVCWGLLKSKDQTMAEGEV